MDFVIWTCKIILVHVLTLEQARVEVLIKLEPRTAHNSAAGCPRPAISAKRHSWPGIASSIALEEIDNPLVAHGGESLIRIALERRAKLGVGAGAPDGGELLLG